MREISKPKQTCEFFRRCRSILPTHGDAVTNSMPKTCSFPPMHAAILKLLKGMIQTLKKSCLTVPPVWHNKRIMPHCLFLALCRALCLYVVVCVLITLLLCAGPKVRQWAAECSIQGPVKRMAVHGHGSRGPMSTNHEISRVGIEWTSRHCSCFDGASAEA